MSHSSSRYNRGISIVEVLIGASMLVVFAAFLSPIFSQNQGKAELSQAVERVQKTGSQAQQTARLNHSNVIMQFKSGKDAQQDSITLTVPAQKTQARQVDEVIEFPEGVRLISERPQIHFDFRGEVDQPTKLMVVSNSTEELTERLLIY